MTTDDQPIYEQVKRDLGYDPASVRRQSHDEFLRERGHELWLKDVLSGVSPRDRAAAVKALKRRQRPQTTSVPIKPSKNGPK